LFVVHIDECYATAIAGDEGDCRAIRTPGSAWIVEVGLGECPEVLPVSVHDP
jgi:hypothetical protein